MSSPRFVFQRDQGGTLPLPCWLIFKKRYLIICQRSADNLKWLNSCKPKTRLE
jgi:hypothetical protein